MLLQHADENSRFEVEVQLGPTDESHIIRTIEYWDIERRRYPQYEHTAVIVAEDVTSRFLNVVSLLNGSVPIVAVQMNALQIGDGVALTFTTVLNPVPLGLVDEDEEVREVTDRSYWIGRGTKQTVALVDRMMELVHRIDPSMELKYNKFYIGLTRDGVTNNFVSFKPKKSWMDAELYLSRSEELEARLEAEGLDVVGYELRGRRYKVRLKAGEVETYGETLADVLREAYEQYMGV